jgi:hypothetical protein
VPTLRELQTSLRASILERDRLDVAHVAAHVNADGIGACARLAVYRHHVFATLTAVLESTFPVVCRLVDRRFFVFAADRYIRDHPPLTPCLFEYGVSFAEFLADFAPCRHLGYLPDVARLEWAINVALHAPEAPPLDPGVARVAPEAVAGLTFRLEPSLTMLASAWPVDQIWRANQPGGDGVVDLDAGGARLEVRRRGDDVVFRTVTPADFAFRDTLWRTGTLQDAADAALSRDGAFDAGAAVRALVDEAALVMPAPHSGT